MKLRLGLLNMMPDKALVVSERHFATLLGAKAGRDLELLRYTLAEIPRDDAAASHIAAHYRAVDQMRRDNLDVLVITGANVSNPVLSQQEFWSPLIDVMDWALASDVPTLCSCLATHGVLEARHGQQRRAVAPKVWGVFAHEKAQPEHQLLTGLPPEVFVPHSRHNDVTAEQFQAAGYDVLLTSPEAGVHLALERERGRWLLLQGHPEYEAVSLLKEYKREVLRWQNDARQDYPSVPSGYLDSATAELLAAHRVTCLAKGRGDSDLLVFPEARIVPQIVDTWTEHAVTVIANWFKTLG